MCLNHLVLFKSFRSRLKWFRQGPFSFVLLPNSVWACHLCKYFQVLDNQLTKGNISNGSSVLAAFLTADIFCQLMLLATGVATFLWSPLLCLHYHRPTHCPRRRMYTGPLFLQFTDQDIPLKSQTKLLWTHSSSFCMYWMTASSGLCLDQSLVEAISGPVHAMVAELLRAWLAWTFRGNQGSLGDLY